MKVKANEVKSLLKENGIPTKNISVSSSYTSITVKLKDLNLPKAKIEQLLRKTYERVDYCEFSGEILAGGNFFVFVSFDYDLVENFVNSIEEELNSKGFSMEEFSQKLLEEKDYSHIYKESKDYMISISLNQNLIFFRETKIGGKGTSFSLSNNGLAWALACFENNNFL